MSANSENHPNSGAAATDPEQELRQALVNFLGERCNKTLFAFFDLLRSGRVLSPAQVEGLPDPGQTTPGQQINIKGPVRIKSSCLMIDGKKYLPVFTCRRELSKGPKVNCIGVPLRHFQQVLDQDPEITALVIDPFSKPNLVIPRDKLADILAGKYREEADPVQQLSLPPDTEIAPPAVFPESLAGSLYVLLSNLDGVEKAWLLEIAPYGEHAEPSWLVIADFHDIRQETLTAMLASAAKKHGQGRNVALMSTSVPRAASLIGLTDPFYVKEEAGTTTPLN